MDQANRGNTLIEALLLILAVVLVFVVGFWVGSDDSSKSTTTTVTTSTGPPSGSATGGEQSAEPDPLSLAAMSLATAPGKKATPVPGGEALVAILGEPSEQRAESGKRAGYWSAVATTIAAVSQMEASAARLKTSTELTQSQTFLQALQARALYQIGALQQMGVPTTQVELMQTLNQTLSGTISQSIDQADKALKSGSDKDAARLSADAAAASKVLTALQSTYSKALAAALAGGYVSANDLLAQMVPIAKKL